MERTRNTFKNNLLLTALMSLAAVCSARVSTAQTSTTSDSKTTWTWDEVVRQARVENPEVTAARENLNSAEAKKTVAFSAFLPTVKANLGYDSSDSSSQVLQTTATSTTTATGWSAGISGNWNLFAGLQDSAKLEQARADVRSAHAAYDLAVAKVSSELKTAFETAAYAREYRKLTSTILKRREDNLKLVQLRFESGRENKGSVLLSEAYLEQARYDDLQANNAARTAGQTLAKILGLDGQSTSEIAVEGNVPLTEPSNRRPDFDSIAASVPEYRQAEEQFTSADQGRVVARGGFLPSLDLTTSITERGEDFFPNARDSSSVGVSLSIPLFTGGKNLGSYRSAIALASAADSTRDNARREARRNLEATWSTYTESLAKLKTDESFRKAAVVRAEIARTKYNNGLLSFEDWDIIENDLITRQKLILQTRRERTSAEAAWEKAQGQGVLK